MKNAIAIVGAAAVLILANSAGWADSDTDRSRTPVFNAYTAYQGPSNIPADIVAMERPTATTNRNVNHFTGRPASGKN